MINSQEESYSHVEPVESEVSKVDNGNFARGINTVDIPELKYKEQGKVRDIWRVGMQRVMVTTDRLSAYDRVICSVPGKGQVLNLLTAHWMAVAKDIIPHHILSVPHPNVVIARQAIATLPVEVVLRRYMAKSSTHTSVYDNYVRQGRRTIYGIEFPDGLEANQEFPMGTIITPTTKAVEGEHDAELDDLQATEMVDRELGQRFGKGLWGQAREAAIALFELGTQVSAEAGLILVDTKYEFGLDENGNLMIIDEVHTPDSSRYWRVETLAAGQKPKGYDKEIVREDLANQGFTGEGPVPQVSPELIDLVTAAYAVPYEKLTGKTLPEAENDPENIRQAVLAAL